MEKKHIVQQLEAQGAQDLVPSESSPIHPSVGVRGAQVRDELAAFNQKRNEHEYLTGGMAVQDLFEICQKQQSLIDQILSILKN